MRASEAVVSQWTQIVSVADREADLFDLFGQPRESRTDLLIRGRQDRRVKFELSGRAHSLKQVLASSELRGVMQLHLQRTPRRRAREAVVGVRWVSVWMLPPEGQEQREPVRVQVLWAREENPPKGDKAIDWMIITTLAIDNLDQAFLYLQWYSFRWLIERYFFVLKSGCRIEQLQLKRVERIEKAIACYAIVAWRWMWLTYFARPTQNEQNDIEADCLLDEREWQALQRYYGEDERECAGPPNLQQCIRWLGQLGGFWGRKSDGDPGIRTIWRGIRRLRDLMEQGGARVSGSISAGNGALFVQRI